MRATRWRRGTWIPVLAAAVWAVAVTSSAPRAEAQREALGAEASSAKAAPTATSDLGRAINQYCAGCHNERARTTATASGVILDQVDLTRVADHGEMWEKVIRKLRAGAMPPAGAPRPDATTHDALVSFLESTLDRAAAARPNPGRQSPHRLNRAEYANAIRDLLALEVDPATLLPPDDSADGFDNNADVLSVSPVLLERYLSAAATISALAVGDPTIIAGSETYRIRGDASQTGQDEALPPGTRGGLMALAHVPARRRVRHQGQAARDQPRLDPRPRVRASARGHRGRRARAARAGRRSRGLHAVVAQRDQRRELARRAAAGAREGARPASGRSARRFCRRPRRRERIGCSRFSAARSSRPIISACRTSRTSPCPGRSMPPARARRQAAARLFICRPAKAHGRAAHARSGSSRRWRGARIGGR